MSYIIGAIVVLLLFLALRYFTAFNTYQQLSIAALLFFIITSAIIYNKYKEKESQKVRDAVLQFKQGKTIHCSGKEINKTNYTLHIYFHR